MPRPAAVLLTAALTLASPPAIVSTAAENAWLVVVDDLHIEFVQTGRLRTLLRTVADELIHDGDRYQLRATGPSTASLQATANFSSDRRMLAPAIRFVTGNGLKLSDAVNLSLDPAPNELLIRANRALDAVEAALAALAAEASSRRAIVFVSAGHDVDTLPHVADRVSSLARRAHQQRITIFAIDARSLSSPLLVDPRPDTDALLRYTTAARRSLTMLAELADGFVVEKTSEPGPDLKRINAQMR